MGNGRGELKRGANKSDICVQHTVRACGDNVALEAAMARRVKLVNSAAFWFHKIF